MMNLKSDIAAKLRDVLNNMSQEEFDKEWAQVTLLNLESPSFSQAIEYFTLKQDESECIEMDATQQLSDSYSIDYKSTAREKE
jgi:hypothetical protein